nr:glycogen debranching protein GlgX [Phaeovulum veldkampii]
MSGAVHIRPGCAAALGATVSAEGVNFALFSAHATRVELCLFSPNGQTEQARLTLPEAEGGIWSGFVPGLKPGAVYGYRVHGPYEPEAGHRFNPNKLLIDPYARQVVGPLVWDDALMGHEVGHPRGDLSFDTRDSAPFVPKAVVCAALPPAAPGPRRPWDETVIYEAHVKGMTARHPAVPRGLRGTYQGLASQPVIDHLVRLGITAIELLPVHAFLDDRFLVAQGLRNYWGYQPIGFFAPEPRYGLSAPILEIRQMVERFHAAGIEVILDVVFNHSGESDETGPTLAFRGIDNSSYYRLTEDGRHYINDTGTGNTLNLSHPMMLRLAMDSLRYWVEQIGIDGFRFDLAATLARGKRGGFSPRAAFLSTLRQDPVLARVKLIAEPWDVGPGGYRLGEFPPPFAEWNDRYRDGVRRFWRGDGSRAELARRIVGSAEIFDVSGRLATTSVNFLSAHDGFTLQDVVSFVKKHNLPNGEGNRDGHSENLSDNFGIEGPSDDPAITAARAARKRAMLATLLLSQGTPMLLAGDEIGHSQRGNNNAYAQDNDTTWLDWAAADPDLVAFVARLTALRRAHPVLRQRRFLHSGLRAEDGLRDLVWRLPSGEEPKGPDWHAPGICCLGAELRVAAAAPCWGAAAAFLVLNPGGPTIMRLPEGRWRMMLDSADPLAPEAEFAAAETPVAAQSVQLFIAAAPEPVQERP